MPTKSNIFIGKTANADNMKKKKIIFICTGNIFRSMSAEHTFRKYLEDNHIQDWEADSAGIHPSRKHPDPKTIEVLGEMNIRNIHHQQKRATSELLKECDIVVAMAQNHYDFIKSKLHCDRVRLFNDLAIHKNTSIWDIEDDVKDHATNRAAVERKIEQTVRYIAEKAPLLYDDIKKTDSSTN